MRIDCPTENSTATGNVVSDRRSSGRQFHLMLGKRMCLHDVPDYLRHDSDCQTDTVESGARDLVKIGTVSKENPTVSNLLIKDPRFGRECWNIVHDAINRDKAFHRIPPGTDIYLDPESREILWGNVPSAGGEMLMPPAGGIKNQPDHGGTGSENDLDLGPENGMIGPIECGACGGEATAGRDSETVAAVYGGLDSALQPFIGKPYKEINCYELVVGGLKKMGIRYHGSDGLKDRLIRMARNNGLPNNAFLNGEGLVRASGFDIYSASVTRVTDPDTQAEDIIREMESSLERGLVLSFSTESRGHTGVVSKTGDQWTYINSGRMDHPVESSRVKMGVGEETLDDEIRNWFRRAARSGESLKISLGRINDSRIAQARPKGSMLEIQI